MPGAQQRAGQKQRRNRGYPTAVPQACSGVRPRVGRARSPRLCSRMGRSHLGGGRHRRPTVRVGCGHRCHPRSRVATSTKPSWLPTNPRPSTGPSPSATPGNAPHRNGTAANGGPVAQRLHTARRADDLDYRRRAIDAKHWQPSADPGRQDDSQWWDTPPQPQPTVEASTEPAPLYADYWRLELVPYLHRARSRRSRPTRLGASPPSTGPLPTRPHNPRPGQHLRHSRLRPAHNGGYLPLGQTRLVRRHYQRPIPLLRHLQISRSLPQHRWTWRRVVGPPEDGRRRFFFFRLATTPYPG